MSASVRTRTELPVGWRLARVGELAQFASGQGISVAALKQRSVDHPVPVYGGNGIAGYTNRALIDAPCAVVGRVGQNCGAVYVTTGPVWITDNALYPRTVHRGVNIRFLALALEAAGLNEERNRNDLPLITQAILHATEVAWAPRAEQESIVAARDDVDALLVRLEALVSKKRDLKQAAMQRLLTGEERLPGYASDWTPISVRDLGAFYGGLAGKTAQDFGVGDARYVPFLSVMNHVEVDCDRLERVCVRHTEVQNRVLEGDLLFNGSSETPEEVAMCAIVPCHDSDVYLNSFCFGLRLRPDCRALGLYLAYLFRSGVGRNLVRSLAQGATRYNVSKAALGRLEVTLPSLDEQRAIAAVLSDMDAEIAALEQRLTKTRALKQAMMQELLTGRTRLTPATNA